MPQRSNWKRVGLGCAAVFALALPLAAQQQGGVQERDPIPSPDDITPGVIAAPKPAATTPSPTTSNPSVPANTGSAAGTSVPATGPEGQPGESNTVSVNTPGKARATGNGQYTFTSTVNEVRLYATVVDQKQRLVSGLNQDDFRVYEDGAPQQITFFRQEDVPVALGIVIDNSGSMREKRERVNDAALNLVKASNPQDEVFIVNFNDEAFLDQEFTFDINQLRNGLEHVDFRGGTALFDAVTGAAKYMIDSAAFLKQRSIAKKVLLVVTDGEDNESRQSLEDAIQYVQKENGPTIYTIGLLGDEHARRARRALEELAVQTGGVAFFPRDLSEVDAISKAVAKDIRNQYLIRYKSSRPQSEGGYRQVRVEAQAPGYPRLQVRTRAGYYAGQNADQPQDEPRAQAAPNKAPRR